MAVHLHLSPHEIKNWSYAQINNVYKNLSDKIKNELSVFGSPDVDKKSSKTSNTAEIKQRLLELKKRGKKNVQLKEVL